MLNAVSYIESVKQRTLKDSISYVGRGLHTGRKVTMRLGSGAANSGIYFVRNDFPIRMIIIPARWNNVIDTKHCTMLGNQHGVSVGTVEHILAALRGCGIDNAVVELDGPEVPIIDGSAEPFVDLIERVGSVVQNKPRRVIQIHRPIAVCNYEKFAVLMPALVPRITVEIDFPYQAVGHQKFSFPLVGDAFQSKVAGARTFGFANELQYLREQGLALGGSLRNAVLVDWNRVVNREGLRFDDEFARHKALDCLGDLALAGAPIHGHFFGYKPGHSLNHALVRQLFIERDAWSYTTMGELAAKSRNQSGVMESVTSPPMIVVLMNCI